MNIDITPKYIICYDGIYKTVFGEDDMQTLVEYLTKQCWYNPDEVMVFDFDSQL